MPVTAVQHPQTKQTLLVFQPQPEMWDGPHVLTLLRMIKQHFPKEFRIVQYELVSLPNGRPGLELPDDIHEKSEGGS